jgi:hypothetical protein
MMDIHIPSGHLASVGGRSEILHVGCQENLMASRELNTQ